LAFSKLFLTFKPIENLKLWFIYLDNLRKALECYGVENVVLSTIAENKSSDSYVILLLDKKSNKILGGIRIEIKSEHNSLPFEKIDVDINIKEIICKKINFHFINNNCRLAELNGLWVSNEAKGLGLGADLILEATKLAKHLNIGAIVATPPLHTLNYFLQLGYVIDTELPKFAYPDERYLSTIVWYHVPVAIKDYSIRDVEI